MDWVPSDDERKPVSTVADLKTLDERDMVAGYWAGYNGRDDEPGVEFNRSYWHGWRNGVADRTGRVDHYQAALAMEVVDSGYLRQHRTEK